MIPAAIDTQLRAIARRCELLERRLDQHYSRREPVHSGYLQTRIAITVAEEGSGSDGDVYPEDERLTGGSVEPNVFAIKFLDAGFELETGDQTAQTAGRTAGMATYALNLTGNYLPEGTIVVVRQLRHTSASYPGQWWIERINTPGPIRFVLTGETTGEVTRVYGYGPEIGDEVGLDFGEFDANLTQVGAVGYATWDNSVGLNGGYVIDLVDQFCLLAKAVLAEPMCGDEGAFPVAVTAFEALTPFPFSLVPDDLFPGGDGDVLNPFHHKGLGPSTGAYDEWIVAGEGSGWNPSVFEGGDRPSPVLLTLDAENLDYLVIDVGKFHVQLTSLPYGIDYYDPPGYWGMVFNCAVEVCDPPVPTQFIRLTADTESQYEIDLS